MQAKLPKAVTPRAGTAVGDGINASVAVVNQTSSQDATTSGYPGAVLLLSDGAQTAGGTPPDAAAATAFVEHVPIDTVTVGTPSGVVTQALTVDGFKTSTQIAVPADPRALEAISHHTGGTSFAGTSAAQLTTISKKLAVVYEGLSSPTRSVRRQWQLSAAAGGVALVLILAGIGVSGRWFGRLA